MSIHSEVTGVNSAVEHLQELADRMQNEDFGFRNKDVSNIDAIIEAIQELSEERQRLHDELETETIKASVLRFSLHDLPAQIKAEITAAVTSARQSNAAALSGLQNELDRITKNIAYLENRQKELEAENSVLHPEREMVRQQHDEIISQLNQRMAEKAGMQIVLNETRDRVRQSNQEIVDLEDGIIQLKEDLIQERGTARNEKKDLKKKVAETTKKTKNQKEVNVEKKKGLDKVQEELKQSDAKLDGLRKSIRQYELSRSKAEGQEKALTNKLDRQTKYNEQLKMKGISIMNEDIRVQEEFNEHENKLMKRLKMLEDEIDKEEDKNTRLENQKVESFTDLEQKMLIRKEDAETVATLDQELQDEKQELAMKAEEVGALQAEIEDMKEKIASLDESHKAVLAQLSKQIEDYREQLSKERKDRMEVQEQKNTVHKGLEEFKQDNQKFMGEMNRKIQEGKAQHVDLTNEGAQLQRELRVDDEEVQRMQAELDAARRDYEEMYNMLQNKLDTMEREIVEMERGVVEKQKALEERTPVFEAFEKEFEARTETYDIMKKNIVVLKNQKLNLEDNISKNKRTQKEMVPTKEKLRHDLKERREEVLQQLKRHAEETQNMEKDIFASGCKLKTVIEENQRFNEACKQTDKDINGVQHEMEDNEKVIARLRAELEKVKAKLAKCWMEDEDLQQLYGKRDQEIVDELEHLLARTGRREHKVSEISDKLQGELVMLAGFLDNLATRRPRVVRKMPPRLSRRETTFDSRISKESKRPSRTGSFGKSGPRKQASKSTEQPSSD